MSLVSFYRNREKVKEIKVQDSLLSILSWKLFHKSIYKLKSVILGRLKLSLTLPSLSYNQLQLGLKMQGKRLVKPCHQNKNESNLNLSLLFKIANMQFCVKMTRQKNLTYKNQIHLLVSQFLRAKRVLVNFIMIKKLFRWHINFTKLNLL